MVKTRDRQQRIPTALIEAVRTRMKKACAPWSLGTREGSLTPMVEQLLIPLQANIGYQMSIMSPGWHLTPVIPATREVGMRGWRFKTSPGKISNPYPKITKAKNGWGHGSSGRVPA
jgi:hypothetical protein